ncbi:polyprenyl synthetase family protein [Hyperthermus butylicus]|uniref:Geranylgeranyl pyrophosphate synthase, IspA n=1 Tax=Hyperthermus butylicus (strain DSM 5456 / JCM 9403 / PLM1-5) TaxID=415426 RepID=A2BIT9_HYPBU|nr:polyprenyl synthetase family protein [Hyperthermus butylicus]ABM79895.1 Geranylgeranyl pyrophosphate synthase, IspA [Hyperthermus butylicus DSM 5456]
MQQIGTSYGGLVEHWKKLRSLVDDAIKQWIARLPEAHAVRVAEYIARGGKRFRGFLVLEIARSLGGRIEDALDAAVAVELIHASSLALDDIIDEDVERRGQKAAWVEYGVKKTVMTVYLLVTFAHKIVEERYGFRATSRTITATLNISRGEVLDAFTDPDSLPPEYYLETVKLKTASLFRLAGELGAIVAGREDLYGEAGLYGEYLGLMYQVADDIVDSRTGTISFPSARMFRKWLGSEGIEKAYKFIANLLTEAEKLAEKLAATPDSYLPILPEFIVSAMLGPDIERVKAYTSRVTRFNPPRHVPRGDNRV